MRSLLSDAFPSKQILSLQTDAFAEKRTRALDAYLQILTHCLRERKLLEQEQEIIRDFFGILENNETTKKVRAAAALPVIKTPNVLNNEIDQLRSTLHTTKDLKSLNRDFDELQETILEKAEDLKLMEKFYEVKREWEVMKIKRGEQYDGFDICKDIKSNSIDRDSIDSKSIDGDINPKDINSIDVDSKSKDGVLKISKTIVTDTVTLTSSTAKHHLREQEAILSDLADTLHQQKQVSLEICEEIIQQNRVIGEFGGRQEGTIGGFMRSTERARKLQ